MPAKMRSTAIRKNAMGKRAVRLPAKMPGTHMMQSAMTKRAYLSAELKSTSMGTAVMNRLRRILSADLQSTVILRNAIRMQAAGNVCRIPFPRKRKAPAGKQKRLLSRT